jgi:DNA-binding response OmpR family regulator
VSTKILIADDEPNIVAALEFLLQRSGYEVHVARNGDEALKLVEATHPDLVLLDVMMPQKSGYEVCMRIRERADWRHIKIIMLSAKGRDAEVSKGLSMGADIYVTKPFSTRELMDKIKDLLGQSTEAGPA